LNDYGIKSADLIADFLLAADKPLPETDVMRFSFDMKGIPSGSRELYERHFLLYHALYAVKAAWGLKGYYFHLHPLRIRLVKLPEGCTYYFEETGEFCGAEMHDGICVFGHHHPDDGLPVFDCLTGFYGDISNIEWDEFEKIERVRKGILLYSFRISDVKKALRFMGFDDIPSGGKIRNRYHELVRLYHPDRNGGDAEKMKTLNEGYALLKSVFVI
jgi:hypothetical protein